jgi:hypothetical protein
LPEEIEPAPEEARGMTTTAQIRSPQTSHGPGEPTRSGSTASETPGFGEIVEEAVPLIDFVPQAGPPAVFVLGPWLFLVLIFGGPLAWLFALLALMIVAAVILAALTATVLAGPYLLVRQLRRRRARQPSVSAPTARVFPIETPRVAA